MIRILRYIALLMRPFWIWWWAVLTGVASILSYLAYPGSDITISRIWLSVLILTFSFSVFLTLSVVTQGWRLYLGRIGELSIVQIQPCKEFDGTHIFLMQGFTNAPAGTLIDVRRPIGDVEAPFALLQLLGSNARGIFQAKPLWFAPGHMSEFAKGKVSLDQLVVDTHVSRERVANYMAEMGSQGT